MQLFVYDCLDRPFHIGDYFTTPQRYSSSMWVCVGRVLGFKVIEVCDGSELRPIVRCAEKHWKRGWEANSKNSVLSRADRATIVSTSSLPQKILDVLGSIPEVPTPAQITLSEESCTT